MQNSESSANTIKIDTPLGVLSAVLHLDPPYPGITLYWGDKQVGVVECNSSLQKMRLHVWPDSAEDPKASYDLEPDEGEAACRYNQYKQLAKKGTLGELIQDLEDRLQLAKRVNREFKDSELRQRAMDIGLGVLRQRGEI